MSKTDNKQTDKKTAPAAEHGADNSADKAMETNDAMVAENEPAKTATTGADSGSHALRNFILLALLVVAAATGALALSGKLQPLYDSLQSRLATSAGSTQHSSVPPAPTDAQHASVAVQQTHELGSAAHDQVPAAAETAMAAERAQALSSQPAQALDSPQSLSEPLSNVQYSDTSLNRAASASIGVPSDEINTLLESMENLREELQQMSGAQQSLQRGLLEQQQMNLQVRLRWISDPASRLAQLQLAWEEISLLPGLSDAQRAQAEQMHALARQRVQQLKQWQDALQQWADALSTPVHQNILPEPPYPWLAWVVRQFSLYRAPSMEARHLDDLRTRLLDARRQLVLESWPEQGAWQSLRAELLLQVKAMRADSGGDAAVVVEIGLPDAFDAMQIDIQTLRQTAAEWARQGGEG